LNVIYFGDRVVLSCSGENYDNSHVVVDLDNFYAGTSNYVVINQPDNKPNQVIQDGMDIETLVAVGSDYTPVANPHQYSYMTGSYPRADTVVNYSSAPIEATAYVNINNADDNPPSLPLPSDQV
jgi:hypothetical protein